jgi:hypothetical protein
MWAKEMRKRSYGKGEEKWLAWWWRRDEAIPTALGKFRERGRKHGVG